MQEENLVALKVAKHSLLKKLIQVHLKKFVHYESFIFCNWIQKEKLSSIVDLLHMKWNISSLFVLTLMIMAYSS